MKIKATIVGGVLVLAMIVGGFLRDMFQGFGPGGGPGNGEREVGRPDPDRPAEPPPPEAPEPRPVQPPDVLEVVIDGDEYFIRQPINDREQLVPADLPQLVELAQAAPGNREGVRVRVYRRGTSLPTAEDALEQALKEEADLERGEVLWVEGLLP